MMNIVVEKHSTYDDKKQKDRGHHRNQVSEQAIALRAFQIWKERGCPHGHDHEDWYQSELELHFTKQRSV